MHEGGFELTLLADGTTTFLRPGWHGVEAAPALPAPLTALEGSSRAPHEIPVWDGTPFDIVYAIDVLYAPHAQNGHAARRESGLQ